MSRSGRFPRFMFAALAALILVLPTVAHAREATWTRIWGDKNDDFAYGVALDRAENAVVVGYTNGALPGERPAGHDDAFSRSYDSNGTLRWSHQFGTPGYDDANGVAVDSAGDSFVVGGVNGALPGQTSTSIVDTFVRKYDTAGNELWTRQFGFPNLSAVGEAVAADPAGNVYVGGNKGTSDPSQVYLPNFIRKYDPDGTELWTVQFGRWPPGTFILGMSFTAGKLFVAGNGAFDVGPNTFTGNAYLKAFDPDGTELWSKDYGGGFASADGIASNAAGRIVVTGSLHGGSFTGEGGGLYVRVLDPDGNVIWTREYNQNHEISDLYNGVAVDDSGDVFVGGTRIDTSNPFVEEEASAQIRRFNADGSDAWTFLPDPYPPNSVVTDLVAAPSGALYVAGAADGNFGHASGVGYIDAYLMKLNQVGTCFDTANPEGNEEGTLSAPIHRRVEPVLPSPVRRPVHKVNCTVVVPAGL